MHEGLFNLPDLTIADLSARVRNLEASNLAMETLLMALVGSHPDPERLREQWSVLRSQADVAAMEMMAMKRPGPNYNPSPETDQFVLDQLHWLDRLLRYTLDQPSS